MARPKQVPPLTSAQAHYILGKLVDDGVVSAADIRRALGEMWSEMSMMERRLAELRAATQPIRHPVRTARKVAKKLRTRVKRVSAERKASQQLQGQYLGYMKQLSERDRRRFKRMAKETGREEAVAAMKAKLGKA